MTQPVYSHRFYLGFAPTALHTAYTVPGGYTAVLKDIEVFTSAANDALDIEVSGPGGSQTTLFLKSVQGASTQWEGMVVLHAGESISVASVSGALGVTISGYLLTEPAAQPT